MDRACGCFLIPFIINFSTDADCVDTKPAVRTVLAAVDNNLVQITLQRHILAILFWPTRAMFFNDSTSWHAQDSHSHRTCQSSSAIY